jgi:signal peptidase II
MKLSAATATPVPIWPWFLLIGTLIGLDQLSKWLAEAYLSLHESRPLLPLLNLSLVYNKGAAFSLFSKLDARWFLFGLSLCISTLAFVWLTRLKPAEKWTRLALSLILAGAIGNLIDRACHGQVIDFIDFFYPSGNGCLPFFQDSGLHCHWPTFNIADSAICIGAALLFISQFFEGKKNNEQ